MLRIHLNDKAILLEPDEEGAFSTELHLPSDDCYIMIDCADFEGSVQLQSSPALS